VTQSNDAIPNRPTIRRSAPISQALRDQLSKVDPRDEAGRTHAQIIADKMIELSMTGDYHFTREVLDRTEGRVRQPVELSLADELIDLVNANGINPHTDPVLSAVFIAAGLASNSSVEDEPTDAASGGTGLRADTLG
jgi:hypothetical protein